MKHTPGPWKLDDDGTIFAAVDPENSSTYMAPVCTVDDEWSDEIAVANARVIAASPDMLEDVLRPMCKDEAFAELCAGIGEEPEWLKNARAILRAIEGE